MIKKKTPNAQRCGTSLLSNHGEVEAGELPKDFLRKVRICLNELRETRRWLRLVSQFGLTERSILRACLDEAEELIRFSRRVSARAKRKRNNAPIV